MGCGFRKGGFSVTEILAAIASGLTELRAKTTAGMLIKDSAGTTVATIGKAGTTAGNARGTDAIDFQYSRSAATQVASGVHAVVLNGTGNTASGTYAAILNGNGNIASGGSAAVLNGSANVASGNYAAVLNGNANAASGTYAVVLNGLSNTASGTYAAVLNGLSNTAYNYCETVVGRYCTISAGNQTGITTADRLFAVGNGTDAGSRSAAFEVFGDGDATVQGDLSAALLSRTPILPPWDDSANPVLTAADTGGTFKFTGTATLPNPATLDEGWTAKLLLGPGAVVDSPVSGQIVYAGDGGGIYSFAAANVVEQASGEATMVIECDGTNFIVTSITGQVASV